MTKNSAAYWRVTWYTPVQLTCSIVQTVNDAQHPDRKMFTRIILNTIHETKPCMVKITCICENEALRSQFTQLLSVWMWFALLVSRGSFASEP